MNKKKLVDIAVIGGTGLYDPDLFQDAKEIEIDTPFGKTSELITIGSYAGKKVAFLPRHGAHHTIPPHKVNYRANLWALKEIGASRVISPRAVGCLNPQMNIGDFVIIDQYLDFTKSRHYTLFDGPEVNHISQCEPLCPELRAITIEKAKELGIVVHEKGTEICIDGPRYSTKAESLFYKDVIHADTIGMTLVPECVIARELGLCFVSIDMITDYDSWKNGEEGVTAALVAESMKKNAENIKKLLLELIKTVSVTEFECDCRNALVGADH